MDIENPNVLLAGEILLCICCLLMLALRQSCAKRRRSGGSTCPPLIHLRWSTTTPPVRNPSITLIGRSLLVERALIVEIMQFSDMIQSVVSDLMPNRICDYLKEISVKFSDFVTKCQVSSNYCDS